MVRCFFYYKQDSNAETHTDTDNELSDNVTLKKNKIAVIIYQMWLLLAYVLTTVPHIKIILTISPGCILIRLSYME